MESPLIFIFLGTLIFFSHTVNAFYSHIRIPGMLLLLLTGVVIGSAKGLISVDNFGKFGKKLTTFTLLIIILFENVISLKLNELRRSIGVVSIFNVINCIICLAIILLMALPGNHMIQYTGYLVVLFSILTINMLVAVLTIKPSTLPDMIVYSAHVNENSYNEKIQ
ncbi:MAG TPA: hypothetical protein VLH16_00735, partial [Bacteroidales bacterium]|nr:hypothetical protein [Bacteroidales bacterium]